MQGQRSDPPDEVIEWSSSERVRDKEERDPTDLVRTQESGDANVDQNLKAQGGSHRHEKPEEDPPSDAMRSIVHAENPANENVL